MRPVRLRQFSIYIPTISLMSLFSCKLSDEGKKLPGGHTYVNEGRCYKYILVNIKDGRNIESCVSEYKYDDNYITVAQIDEVKCDQSALITNGDKKFFIIDNKNQQLLGPFSHDSFKVHFDILQISRNIFLE